MEVYYNGIPQIRRVIYVYEGIYYYNIYVGVSWLDWVCVRTYKVQLCQLDRG